MLIADTGAIYAFYDGSDEYHEKARSIVNDNSGHIIVPQGIIAEVDYLLLKLLGIDAELDFIQDLLSGVYKLHPISTAALQRCYELISQYRDLELGLSDSIVMATAEELKVYEIFTVDERDFRAVKLQSALTLVLFD